MIRIGREIQCLPYAGFFLDKYASVKTNNKYTLFYIRCTKRWRSHYGGRGYFLFHSRLQMHHSFVQNYISTQPSKYALFSLQIHIRQPKLIKVE